MSRGRGQRMAGGVATNLVEMPTCPLWHHKGIISRTFLKADASEDIKLRQTFLISGDVCWKKIWSNEFCEIWDLYCSNPESLKRTRLQNQVGQGHLKSASPCFSITSSFDWRGLLKHQLERPAKQIYSVSAFRLIIWPAAEEKVGQQMFMLTCQSCRRQQQQQRDQRSAEGAVQEKV